MQDAMSATGRRLRRLAAVGPTAVAALAATAEGASAASAVSTTGPRVALDVVGSQDSVSPSTAADPTFVSYGVTVTNESPSTVTHLTLTDSLPAGSTLVSVTASTGTCASGADAVSCAFGSVPSNGKVTVTILVEAPRIEGLVTNTATASFDEGPSDNPANGGKQDTVTVSVSTAVSAAIAASLVPSDTEVRLDTDPTRVDVASPQDENIGKALVPASPHPPVNASLTEETAPFTCPKKQICRDGAWLHADIGAGAAFSPALQFELHWSKLLVAKQQTTKNLAVLHTDCLVGCAIDVISRRCSSSNPPPTEPLPCLSDVVETASEFRATLHSSTNGYMR